MKKLLLLYLLFVSNAVAAQTGSTLKGIAPASFTFTVLEDSNYTFNQVITGGLPFVTNDSIRPFKHRFYWLKIVIANPDHFAGQYAIEAQPHLLNTYYYFDVNRQTWLQQTAGILTNSINGRTKEMAMHLLMQPYAQNVVYVKMDVSRLAQFGLAIKPVVTIDYQAAIDKKGKIIWDGWLIAVAVVSFFFISNLYLYVSFRDKPVIFYLVLQLGAIIYITSYRRYISLNLFSLWVKPDGTVRYYGFNNLMLHISIVLMVYGFTQLCRSYLNTKRYLPRADVLLKYGMYSYMLMSGILMVINVFYYLERYTLVYDNIFLLGLIIIMGSTCLAGYRLKLRASGAFLLALVLPLTIITGIPVFYLFISVNGDHNLWLPNLAVASDAVLFSAALVTRTKVIQSELALKALEMQQLNFDLQAAELKHNLAELEIKQIHSDMQNEKARYELLQDKLDANQRQLASTAVYMVKKNQSLDRLRIKIAALKKISGNSTLKEFAELEAILKDSHHFDDEWGNFKIHFEQVHPNFFSDLQANYPTLTKSEIRLYAYFHIHLSTKEIALLLSITPASVRQAKMRLYRKIGQPALLEKIDEHEDDEIAEP